MIKKCDEAVFTERLSLIYKDCVDNRIFSNVWKKSNVVPVCKKEVSR